jgi:hypothetical protein
MPRGLTSKMKGDGVDDGTRTRDGRNHNPGLYQLSYVHHRLHNSRQGGAPGRNRTCNRRLRRPVLYPVELRALYKSIGYSANRNLSRPMLGSTHTESEVGANYIGLSWFLNRLLLDGSLEPLERPIPLRGNDLEGLARFQ